MRLFKYFIYFICIAFHTNAQQYFLHTTISKVGQVTSSGCSWADFNNDGWQDLFISNWARDNDVLYRNNGDGTLTLLSNSIISTDGDASSGGTWGDYDNDGFVDLFVPTESHNLLYRNNGDETFTLITNGVIAEDPVPPHAIAGTRSSSWGDFNCDGFLDLYVSNVGARSVLYQNNGDGSFTKIGQGLIVEDLFSVSGSSWIDYDNDFDQDLFLSSSNVARLYQNNGVNGFSTLLQIGEAGMITTFSWGDFDNDEYFDLLVGYGNSGGDVSLYRNNHDGTFTEVENTGMTTGGYGARGSGWGDINNDGLLDAFFTNVQGLNGVNLYLNNGGGTFTRVTGEDFTLTGPESTSLCDYNNDGFLDILVNTHHGDIVNHLFTNRGGSNHWLEVDPKSANQPVVGTKITVSFRNQSRMIESSSGHLAQSASIAHFGLGEASEVDLTIIWPSGNVQYITNVAANQKLVVYENALENVNIDIGPDRIICDDLNTTIKAPEGFDVYHWNNDVKSSATTVDQSGLYFVEAKVGCRVVGDSVFVEFLTTPELQLGEDIETCDDLPVSLGSASENVSVLWNTGDTTSYITVNKSGKYWAKIENKCGISGDTVHIQFVKPVEELELGADTILCAGQPYQLKVPDEYLDVRWNNSLTTQVIDVIAEGFYSVTGRVKNCLYTDSVEIKFDHTPTSLFPTEEVLLCKLSELKLSPGQNFSSYMWQDGSTDSTLTAYSPGQYSVSVRNACGLFKDTIDLALFDPSLLVIPNVITPNGDFKNETFVVDNNLIGGRLEVFNRSGQRVFYSSNYQNNWDAGGLEVGVYYFLITENYCSFRVNGWVNVLR